MKWVAETDAGTVLLVVLAASLAVGFAVGRWAAALLPPLAALVYYVGLWKEAWGGGVGDFWWLFMLVFAAAGAFAAAMGVTVRRVTTSRFAGRPERA